MKNNRKYRLIATVICIFSRLESQIENYKNINEILPLIRILCRFLCNYEKKNDLRASSDLHDAFEMLKDPHMKIAVKYQHDAEDLSLADLMQFITEYWDEVKYVYKTYSLIICCLLLADLPDDEEIIEEKFIQATLTELTSDNSLI